MPCHGSVYLRSSYLWGFGVAKFAERLPARLRSPGRTSQLASLRSGLAFPREAGSLCTRGGEQCFRSVHVGAGRWAKGRVC